VLDIPQLSIDETFFHAGGTSVSTVRIRNAVEREFGVRLPLEALFADATVEHVARAIRDGYTGSPRSLMAIRPGSRPPVLVCIHPLSGDIEFYHELIDALPKSVPCVGLKSLGLDLRCEPHRDVPAMAAHYLDELTAKFDPSEIVVAGYSLGGLVAFEMACQMDERSTPLRGLMIIDTVAPQPYRPTPPTASLRMLVEDVLQLGLDVDEIAALPADKMCAAILDAAERAGTLPVGYGQDRLQRMIEVVDSNYEAAARYQLRTYRRPAHLVAAGTAEERDPNTAAWRSHCSAGLEVYDIGGSHANVLFGARAAEVAEVFWKLWWEQ
jgi:thioesterase domain-containing protein/acyl carrier protein